MKAEKDRQGRSGDVPAVSGMPAQPNRLIWEASPYLVQHAYNPVDWYPWGTDAFERASTQNRPILLSIGYSACHWCHVMERESFSDPEVARLVNDSFVAVKVDREERPDVDAVYMAFCHAMGGSCGWPLTVVMTPDRKPFYVTAYVPRQNRQGHAGIVTLLSHIRDLWVERGGRVVESADHLAAIVGSKVLEQGVEHVDESAIDAAFHDLETSFDRETGGFGGAPKFPMATTLMFLLRYWRRTGNPNALQMTERTLQSMRRGGIYDHLGWGFHRYATDSAWLVPHYEKMLYDQALLAMTYAEAFQATGDPQYEAVARETIAYVERDLRAPGGGFFSAEDAESEGIEGKFYLWDERDLRRALTPEEASLAARVFGVKKTGNFIESASGYMPGQNILHLSKPLPAIAAELGLSEEDLRARVERIREKLHAGRSARSRPTRDEKVLTDWNGLMIAALSVAAQALDEPAYAAGAARAAEFVLRNLRREDGRLLHRWRDGIAGVDGTAGDYAYLVWGLIELYEATLDVRWLREALALNARMHRDFWDPDGGGFFATAHDAEGLPLRLKELYDAATPSASAAGLVNTLRLARMTADNELEEKALTMIRGLGASVLRYPSSHGWLLSALDFHVRGSLQVVISGREGADDTRKLLSAVRSRFIPEKVLLLRPFPPEDHEVTKIADYTRAQLPRGGKATAYVCHNFACALPTTNAGEMLEQLKVGGVKKGS